MDNLSEIQYVSRLLRSEMAMKKKLTCKDHDGEIEINFPKYCKSLFETEEKILPDFSKEICLQRFLVLAEKLK